MLNWHEQAARSALKRLWPRLHPHLTVEPAQQAVFLERLNAHWPRLFALLHELYGAHYDFFYHLEQILIHMAQAYSQRPAALHALDAARVADPHWHQRRGMIGAVCYVDLFADDLLGLRQKIPYFKELRLSYLHLMPLFKAPEADSDGGYAISDYRVVDPRLGSMDDLRALADELRANGISLVLDFVLNHTSDEHTWARLAQQGDEDYRQFYLIFPDRTLPDQYERHLREIFPEQAPGNFTYQPEMQAWVWTTFKRFQWDLNYSNAAVFTAMMGEMLFLANQGAEILRLDAVAFMWKQLGTPCESLPQVHTLVRAYNQVARIVAPGLLFKSEAIVHPDMVASYIDPDESQLSYNPTLMALLWEALATRDVALLSASMQKRFALPAGCTWVNYVRVHDDIGWTFADEDAARLGIDGFQHRQFLNRFYTGQFVGSFAKGLPFNENPITRDMRISGMGASLAGLEQALQLNNPLYVDHALKRLLLIASVMLGVGGIPLIYLGDEIATLNDYSYQDDPDKANDSRWVHRPSFDWARAAARQDTSTPQGWLFKRLQALIDLRLSLPGLDDLQTHFFDSWNRQVLAYSRRGLLALANFSERPALVARQHLLAHAEAQTQLVDLVSGTAFPVADDLLLEPYQFVWLQTHA